MALSHAAARKALRETHQVRWQAEALRRQERFSRGLRGLLDRPTGHHRRVKASNEREVQQAHERDQKERDALVFEQLAQRRSLQGRIQEEELSTTTPAWSFEPEPSGPVVSESETPCTTCTWGPRVRVPENNVSSSRPAARTLSSRRPG